MTALTIAAPPAITATLQKLAALLGPMPGHAELRLESAHLVLTTQSGTTSIPLPISLTALAALLRPALTLRLHSLGHGWQFDPARRTCIHEGIPAIPLTDKESALLSALLAASPLTRETLAHTVWGHESGVDSHTFDTHLYRLRQKLEPIEGLAIRVEASKYSLSTP